MHIVRVLLTVVVSGCPAILATPVPNPEEKTPLYFPIKEGTRLVYQVRSRARTETIAKVEAKGEVFRVTVERGPNEKWKFVYEVSAKGVALVVGNGEELASPRPILKLPAKEGDKWTAKENNVTYSYTVGKEEEIEVPAGKFKAIPITSEIVISGPGGKKGTLKETTWFAPGTGEVKRVVKSPGGNESETVLKSITLG